MFRSLIPTLARAAVVAALCAPLAAATASAQDTAAAQRIGVVDLQRALNTVEEGVAARARLESDMARRQQEFETAQATLEQQAAEFQAAMTMMTQEAAMQRYQELQAQALQLEEQYQQHQVELATAEAEATDAIAERMVVIVSEIATAQGYTAVIDRSSVVFAVDAIDVTDDLIRIYDERH